MRLGERLACAGCGAQVIITVPGSGEPECSGSPMSGAVTPAAQDGHDVPGTGVLIGKRYACDRCGQAFICVSTGTGTITCCGTPVALVATRQLPASD